MEKIPLIASIICAFTSMTTALRGLARSREYTDKDIEALRSSARLSGIINKQRFSSTHNLFFYRLSTAIWFILAVVFAAPEYLRFWADKNVFSVIAFISAFITLAVAILFVWQKVEK